jgi:predicted DsbA family dithiol-disulfide isomerase
MRIDFVSDVACPWCAVGLNALEIALQRVGAEVPVELHFQPFELHPDMAAEGADAGEFLRRKYSLSEAQLAQNRGVIRERGAAVGFAFGDRARVWNTFHAHRLLYWAGLLVDAATCPPGLGVDVDAQRRLKHALLQAYHGDNRNPDDKAVLLAVATAAGLDADAARAVLDSDRYADEVRAAERHWQQAGIRSVPAIVINQRHLISGGQPPEVFEQALRQIAAEAAAA